MKLTAKRLEGRPALITGAGRGIGLAIAQRFAAEGAIIHVCDLSDDLVGEGVEAIRAAGGQADGEAFDVRDADAIQAFVDRAGRSNDGVSILVNNAAVMPVQPIETMAVESVDQVLAVNLRAPILFSNAALPWMRRRSGGVILHTASTQAHVGSPHMAVYAATKAGLVVLAQAQAKSWAADGIRVNTVSPGTVDSPMFEYEANRHPEGPEAYRRTADRLHPRGRIATMDEVAATFAFLASDDAANITATDLRCDGGLAVAG
jgi:NAD(P)-dependent dehydrogenase (short-subunit alcohol dehydrogenase family)